MNQRTWPRGTSPVFPGPIVTSQLLSDAVAVCTIASLLFHTIVSPILALTSSTLEYDLGGEARREHADAILVNSAKISALEAATDADLGLAKGPELQVPLSAGSKDLTGI